MLSRISTTQRRWAFWLCLGAVLVLALMRPTHFMPSTGWDKANHALAFAVLAILGCLSYPGRGPRVLAGLLAYGALIELLQTLTGYRSGEWLDLVADTIGLALGWQIARRLPAANPLRTAPTDLRGR
ncbi:VanZ family protein [Ramlibacter sp.]|uniref:VanZ family protein n=1 Tax=Ramlibacter sp. TaxID=1917967 RepID=UPI002C5A77B4|nr:VanZ family protein [Ramlibacter sp.]HWI82211.1 VanZ family protein [Ramlibacter sp.]